MRRLLLALLLCLVFAASAQAMITYDGGDDSTLLNSSSTLNVTNITVMAWVRTVETSAFQTAVSRWNNDGANGSWILGVGSVASNYRWLVRVGEVNYVGTQNGTGFAINTWTHLAGTYDGETALLYVDGTQTGSDTAPSGNLDTNDTVTVYAGNRDNNSVPADVIWSGQISDIRIYNRALTATEIAAVASARLKEVDASSTGLIGYWPLDDQPDGCPGSSDACNSAGGPRCQITNFPTPGYSSYSTTEVPTVLPSGSSLDFDGTDDIMNCTDIAALDTATDLSFCAWVKHDTLTTDDAIIGKLASTSVDGPLLQRDDVAATSGRTDTYKISVADGGDTDVGELEGATNASVSGVWTHVCATMDLGSATGLRLYVNGTEDANSPTSLALIGSFDSGTTQLSIGATAEAANRAFDGRIDDARIYNTILTAANVSDLYAGVHISSGLVQWWKFDNTGRAADRSGNGLDGYGGDGGLVNLTGNTAGAETFLSYPGMVQ